MNTVRMLKRLLRRDRGAAMPMVLLVFLMSIALVGALLTAIYGSSSVSGSTRAGIQSEAAAEAGIDAAIAAMGDQNPCRGLGTITSTVEPRYESTVACNLSQQRVTITSTGTGRDGSQQRIEAVYPMTVLNAPSWLEMENNLTLKGNTGIRNHPKQPPNDISTLFLRDGDFSCTTAATFYEANIVLADGRAVIKNCAQITGDVWATGAITDGKNNITGPKYHPNTPKTHPIMKRPKFVQITKNDIGGYFEAKLTATNTPSAIKTAVEGQTRPGVLDLTGKGKVTLSGTYNFKQDVVILGDQFFLEKGTRFAGGSGDIKRFWLVVPSPGTGQIMVDAQGNGVGFDDNVVGMLYTNGLTDMTNQGNSPWSGVIYSGLFEMPSNPNNQFLRYYGMPLPGANMTLNNPNDYRLGALAYQRNIPV